jgi:hypothetical protein
MYFPWNISLYNIEKEKNYTFAIKAYPKDRLTCLELQKCAQFLALTDLGSIFFKFIYI